jgi:hypothetical protein
MLANPRGNQEAMNIDITTDTFAHYYIIENNLIFPADQLYEHRVPNRNLCCLENLRKCKERIRNGLEESFPYIKI